MTDLEIDDLRATPSPTSKQLEEMMHGLIGDFAQTAACGKGLNPIATALACMTWLSAEVGPRITISIGDEKHPARIYGLHVAPTSGGKGSSLAFVNRVREKINESYPDLLGQRYDSSISSGEGLALKIHDGFIQDGKKLPPVGDKRLFLVEAEFAQVLTQTKREGNTVGTVLRNIWDYGKSISPMTKSERIWATDPHVSILGNITPFELRSKLTKNEIHGGTLNRVLMVYAEKKESVAFPEPTSENDVERFVEKISRIVNFAKGNYGNNSFSHSEHCCATLSHEAKELWQKEFESLDSSFGNELVTAATSRKHTYALRISLLYAICDQSLVVDLDHLKAGIAWAKFSAVSAEYVLTAGKEESTPADPKKIEKLINFLTENNGTASRTDISKLCYNGHVNKDEFDKILQHLLNLRKIRKETLFVDSSAGKRPMFIYHLA
jgi:hypothetical protein